MEGGGGGLGEGREGEGGEEGGGGLESGVLLFPVPWISTKRKKEREENPTTEKNKTEPKELDFPFPRAWPRWFDRRAREKTC